MSLALRQNIQLHSYHNNMLVSRILMLKMSFLDLCFCEYTVTQGYRDICSVGTNITSTPCSMYATWSRNNLQHYTQNKHLTADLFLLQLCTEFFFFFFRVHLRWGLWCLVIWFKLVSDDNYLHASPMSAVQCVNSWVEKFLYSSHDKKTNTKKIRRFRLSEVLRHSFKLGPAWTDIWLSFIMYYSSCLAMQRRWRLYLCVLVCVCAFLFNRLIYVHINRQQFMSSL